MRVGWLVDQGPVTGGAEHTQAEFRSYAPDGVEVVDCPPGCVIPGLDRYVIHNCMHYELADLERIDGPVVRYWHDVGPWLSPAVMEWLRRYAKHIFCSPLQRDYMNRGEGREDKPETAMDGPLIPPPVDLALFEQAAGSSNGDRRGAVSVGSWRNIGKAPHRVMEWSQQLGQPVDFYGSGPFAPHGSVEVPYDQMPALLASYETFVFLPSVLEPFGRLVAEAWAGGCAIVTNGLVGARYWIEENPGAIETAGEDFWRTVVT